MMLSVAMLSAKSRSGNGDGLFVCSIREIASDSGRNDYLCSTKDRLLRGRPCRERVRFVVRREWKPNCQP